MTKAVTGNLSFFENALRD